MCFSLDKCAKDQFRCDSGQCVSNVFCRDGEYHCRDKSDELKCKQRKRRDAAKCKFSDRKLHVFFSSSKIFHYHGTLKYYNYILKTTEKEKRSSKLNYFCILAKPKVGSLVVKPQANETTIQKNPCEGQTESFFCPSAIGTDNQCITKSWLCDGENDCPDGTDELNSTCESVQCQENEFKCANGKCEKKKQVCDGIDDCGDNSDEDYALCHRTLFFLLCFVICFFF